MTAAQNPNETFFLARYAYNQLRPLVDALEVMGLHPQLSVEVVCASNRHENTGHVSAFVHWDREGMFLYKPRLQSQTTIDAVATKVREDIDKLKAEAQQIVDVLPLLEPVSY